MYRPFVGLAITCFLVGCGTKAPEPAVTASGGASVAPVEDTAETKKADTSTHTVAFSVPGMT